MLKAIDSFLDRITMYRLVLYYLIGLVGLAFGFSFLGWVSYRPLEILQGTVLVVGSKYLLTVEKQHLFNPVAAGLVGAALLSDHSGVWWMGVPAMLPFVVLGGFLVVRRIQREAMVATAISLFFLRKSRTCCLVNSIQP